MRDNLRVSALRERVKSALDHLTDKGVLFDDGHEYAEELLMGLFREGSEVGVTSSKIPSVRVVSDGTSPGSMVTVDGQPLNGVTSVTWTCGGKGYATATITIDFVEVDVELPLDQVTTKDDRMSNNVGPELSFTREQVERLVSAGVLDSSASLGVSDAASVTAAVMRNVWPLVEALQEANHA